MVSRKQINKCIRFEKSTIKKFKMDFPVCDLLKLKKILNNESSSDEDVPSSNKTSKMGPGDLTKSIKIKGNESKQEKYNNISRDPNSIWQLYEVPESPQTDDILSDPRLKPNYNIRYQQLVGTEDVYLQMGNKTPTTASCEGIVVEIEMKGENKNGIDCQVTETHLDIRSPSYRLNLGLPHKVIPESCSAEWNGSASLLIVNLILTREYDYINF